MRKEFDQGRRQSLYQHWSPEVYFKHVRSYMERLLVPKELRGHDFVLIMLTIIFPCTTKYVQPKSNFEERHQMITVFRENCRKSRKQFFSNPLVRYLWSEVFIKRNPEIIKVQLRRMRTDREKGEVAVRKFIDSMQEIQDTHKVVFLRQEDKLSSIEALTAEEEYEYLLQNGKYLKRERHRVGSQLTKFQTSLCLDIKNN